MSRAHGIAKWSGTAICAALGMAWLLSLKFAAGFMLSGFQCELSGGLLTLAYADGGSDCYVEQYDAP